MNGRWLLVVPLFHGCMALVGGVCLMWGAGLHLLAQGADDATTFEFPEDD